MPCKLFGTPFFGVAEHDGYREYFLFGKKLFKTKGPGKIFQQSYCPTGFDSRETDLAIQNFVDSTYSYTPSHDVRQNNVAVLATEFYDVGGHTECAKRLYLNLSDKYHFTTFFTHISVTYKSAPEKLKIIKPHTFIDGLDCEDGDFTKNIGTLFEKIRNFAPKVIFAIIHPDDAIATAVLALIHKNLDSRILYFCHASHRPALGYSFSDLILVALPSTHYMDKMYRKMNKHCVIGMLSEKTESLELASEAKITAVRKELGIKEGELCTMSGAAACKFFDGKESPYFVLLRRLLDKVPHLKHVVISDFSQKEMQRIHHIVGGKRMERISFVPRTPRYEILFQACDLFIDSFPFSSALTMLDLMKWKVPVVVKINTDNALYSFHEYMPAAYPHCYETIEDMEVGILSMLKNPALRESAVAMNYAHYIKNYDGSIVRERYIKLIDEADKIEKFYARLDPLLSYSFQIKESTNC